MNQQPSVLRKLAIRGGILVAVIGIGIQFIPYKAEGLENPPNQPPLQEPPEVVAILKRACYDCHSHETKYPFYSLIAPGKWLLAHDVVEGRAALNFSEWPEDEEDRQFNREQALEILLEGEMPPWFYLPAHPEAKLTEKDMAILNAWGAEKEDEDEDEDEDE